MHSTAASRPVATTSTICVSVAKRSYCPTIQTPRAKSELQRQKQTATERLKERSVSQVQLYLNF